VVSGIGHLFLLNCLMAVHFPSHTFAEPPGYNQCV